MSGKYDALREDWERATERIDAWTELTPFLRTNGGDELLAQFAEFADAVQCYLGIEVNHDRLENT